MSRTAVLLAVKMNVVLPFSLYDYDQAVDWIEWVAEFCGIQERHVLWLLPFKGMNSSRTTEAAKKAFKFVHEIQEAEGITIMRQRFHGSVRQHQRTRTYERFRRVSR